jgi:hypothetical protein
MDYLKLLAGIGLLIVFGWLLVRNAHRKGFINGLFAIDTLLGLIAGLYLVITSLNALWS